MAVIIGDLIMEVAPRVSIIMGVYNCEKTLAKSIQCIIDQSFTDWEFIICDDGSKDRTYRILQHFKELYPEKIIVLRHKHNKGLNKTLNHCLRYAKGQYIARMDADDVCSPDRLKIEFDTLEREKDLHIVSTDMSYFDESGTWGCISHPEYPKPIDFIKGTPFCHAPCMVRKEAFDLVGGYSEGKLLLRVEDYHLWIKMYSKGLKGKNIHQALYQMRDDRNAYARRGLKYRINEAYVHVLAVQKLRLPLYGYLYAIRPILVGLLPHYIYDLLHKRNLKKV